MRLRKVQKEQIFSHNNYISDQVISEFNSNKVPEIIDG